MTTLAIDIGNSSWKLGLFEGHELVRTVRVESSMIAMLRDFAEAHKPARVVFCSVVPAASKQVRQMLSGQKAQVMEVQGDLELPFSLEYTSPETLGADRLASAAGGVALYPGVDPLITIDAGTAVTAEVIHRGRFLGGAIAPGPALLAQSMADGTAQLPLVVPRTDTQAIASNTVGSLTSGVSAMFIGGVRELVARMDREIGEASTVIVTGGWGEWLARELPGTRFEPHLVLHGLLSLGNLNADRLP